MKVTNIRSCPICKQVGKIINSNNPLSPGICEKCLSEMVDGKDLKQVDFFCRTYNIPFNPDTWIRIYSQAGNLSFEHYVQVVSDEHALNFTYKCSDDNAPVWDQINAIWRKNWTHGELLQQIQSIKDDWLKQMHIKWGPSYEFTEYLKLENLFNNTIQGTGTTSPLTIDIIKKIAVVSVLMDRSLINGEIEEAGKYSKMHRDLIKAAGLEEMIDVTENDVISTVSDLCNYLEQKGFKFDFYDGVKRDIVDMTIEDIKEWTVNYVRDATGIQQTYAMVEDSFKTSLEVNKTSEATSKVTLEDLIRAKKEGANEKLDAELESEEWDLDEYLEL